MNPNLDLKQLAELSLVIQDAYNQGADNLANWRQSIEMWQRMMMPVKFAQRVQLFPFMLPTMAAEYIPEGVEPSFQALTGKDVRITVRRLSVGVEVNKIDFNYPLNRQNFMYQIAGMPQQLEMEVVYEMFSALNDGESDPKWTVYDGEQLFSQNHAVGALDDQWSNLFVGSGTDVPDLAADLKRAYVNFSQIPFGPRGRFLNTNGAQFMIICGPELKQQFSELVNNTRKPQAGFNTENRDVDFMGTPNIGNTVKLQDTNLFTSGSGNDWILVMSLPGWVPPFIRCELEPFQLRTDMTLGGLADLKGQYRWWSEGWVSPFPNHFFAMTKFVNS